MNGSWQIRCQVSAPPSCSFRFALWLFGSPRTRLPNRSNRRIRRSRLHPPSHTPARHDGHSRALYAARPDGCRRSPGTTPAPRTRTSVAGLLGRARQGHPGREAGRRDPRPRARPGRQLSRHRRDGVGHSPLLAHRPGGGRAVGPARVPDRPQGRATVNQTSEPLTLLPGGRTLVAALEGPLTGDGKDRLGRSVRRIQTWERRRDGRFVLGRQ
ncbi:esterase-like activity of phytase family protein [Streptomyces sp. NPDC056194]|uniref:esterase-like activity of phytase family protein n=1 Tax=unclassified Streptomyces TaxID=2593676 RepID=UPI0035DE2DD8